MKILILGSNGFVGKNIVSKLKNTDHRIITLSKSDNVDLRNYEKTRSFFEKTMPDDIINVATHGGSVHYVSKHAADIINDNLQMTLNVYRAIKEVCANSKIINPISNCSYPGTSDIQRENEWLNGEVHDSVFAFGNYKRMVYVIAKCYQQQYNIKSINFLIPNAFGVGDYTDPNKTHALNGMIIRMIKAQQNGEEKFEIWGTGKPIREWIYIKDFVNILVNGLEIDKNIIYPLNIGQNKGYSIKESARLIAEGLNFTGKLFFNEEYSDGAPIKILDDKKFRDIFPDYKFYDHKQGIEETINYYKTIL